MRRQIFTAIAERLLTVPGITYVDLWNDNGAHFAAARFTPALYKLDYAHVGLTILEVVHLSHLFFYTYSI